jgi:hypothetical protein
MSRMSWSEVFGGRRKHFAGRLDESSSQGQLENNYAARR